jgi:hypothetical protein
MIINPNKLEKIVPITKAIIPAYHAIKILPNKRINIFDKTTQIVKYVSTIGVIAFCIPPG